MSVAECPRTEDFIWQFESINILLEGAVFLEHASSLNSKLRYTLIFVKSLLVQIDLCSFCLSLNMCFRCSSNRYESACCITVSKSDNVYTKELRAFQRETKI